MWRHDGPDDRTLAADAHWVGALIVPVRDSRLGRLAERTGARGAVFLLTYLLLLASIGRRRQFRSRTPDRARCSPFGLLFAPGALAYRPSIFGTEQGRHASIAIDLTRRRGMWRP
jgi:hypothetical protein